MSIPVTETAAPAEAPSAPPPPAPLASRIVDTFFAPTKVFEQFRDGASPWLGPVLVGVGVIVLLTALRPLFITNRQMADFVIEQMQNSGRSLPPGMNVDDFAAKMPVQGWVFAAIGIVASFAVVWIVALVLAGIYGLVLGGRTHLPTYAAVTSHAFLVSTLGLLLVGMVQYATHRLDIRLDAALLAPNLDPRSVAAGVLHGITPFGVWTAALLGLGGATVNRRKGWVGVAALLFALQLALVTAGTLLGHLLGGRSGS